MPLSRRQAIAAMGAGLALPWTPSMAAAQLVKLVVPYTPGTGIDLIARTLSPALAKSMDRTFVVENKAGASGNIGTEAVVRAAPDGNTLLVSVNTLVMNASLYPTLPFDPVRDLEPVALTSWGQLILVSPAERPYRKVADLLAAARGKPDQLNYASPGVGTPHHMSMELLKNRTGMRIMHVPYRGTGPAVTDLIGGQVDCMFLPIHVALPHVKSGRLRALGIGSKQRHALLPDVPTLAQAGVGEIDVAMWYGVFAPKDTPAEVIQAYNAQINQALGSTTVKVAFASQGMDPATASPQEFKKLVADDAKRWAEVVRQQGIEGV